jgi:hypothetical protein
MMRVLCQGGNHFNLKWMLSKKLQFLFSSVYLQLSVLALSQLLLLSKLVYNLVLGRVIDSSSHDSILFAFFAGEREDSSLCQGLASRSLPQVISEKDKM